MLKISAQPVTLVTGDGIARDARTYEDGSYSCPHCSAAVIGPEGWADNEANNAAIYAKTGDSYEPQPYSQGMRAAWELRTCANPGCLVNLPAERCREIRQANADRQAEADRRTAQHARAMQDIADRRERDANLWQELSAKASEAGQCPACLRASDWAYGRPRFVRHRDASNCPVARKYA